MLSCPARQKARHGDGSPMEEVGAVRFVDLEEALAMCRSGAIEDAKTEIGLRRLKEHTGTVPLCGRSQDAGT